MQSQTGELTYQKVDVTNLNIALAIIRRIWPNEEPDADYLAKPLQPKDVGNISWLVYHNDNLVGLTGVFTFDSDEPGYDQGESLWMDWFAILPEFRRQHFWSASAA